MKQVMWIGIVGAMVGSVLSVAFAVALWVALHHPAAAKEWAVYAPSFSMVSNGKLAPCHPNYGIEFVKNAEACNRECDAVKSGSERADCYLKCGL